MQTTILVSQLKSPFYGMLLLSLAVGSIISSFYQMVEPLAGDLEMMANLDMEITLQLTLQNKSLLTLDIN